MRVIVTDVGTPTIIEAFDGETATMVHVGMWVSVDLVDSAARGAIATRTPIGAAVQQAIIAAAASCVGTSERRACQRRSCAERSPVRRVTRAETDSSAATTRHSTPAISIAPAYENGWRRTN